jgi:hypothetical protein
MNFIRFSTTIKNVVSLFTLTHHGRISFNTIATERLDLKSFKYVVLFYHAGRKIIKIQLTNDDKETGALALLQTPTGATINGKRFLDYFDIRPPLRDAYKIRALSPNILLVNLKHPYERKWVKVKKEEISKNPQLTLSFRGYQRSGYQRFTNSSRGLTPMMTLSSYGRMTFNTACRERYRIPSYKYCLLFYDEIEQFIKIKLTNNVKEEGVIPLENNVAATHISGKFFLKHFNILPELSTMYRLYCPRGDDFIVDLKAPHVKTHRIRPPKVKSQE